MGRILLALLMIALAAARDASGYLISVFEFVILIHFFSQTNYVAYHSNLFYQILGRPNDPKDVGLAFLAAVVIAAEKTVDMFRAIALPKCDGTDGSYPAGSL